ncbi:carbohydrate kinase family protein [Sphaerisporangium aureirubrum]|uniref:Carbohydrate kinase n=1 Tax=Sphaerisporangium aureirubrum TaxID=1544736 RepID=A0ABW1NDB7_9ACTN
MSSGPIAVLGECVADAVVTAAGNGPYDLTLRVLPGGGPANTAVALARLGTPARFLGRLSGDRFGRLFADHLAASGTDLSMCVAAVEPSTLAVADIDAHGRASYSFYAEGTADWQWTPAELDLGRLTGAICLHTGSLALARDPGGPLVEGFIAAARPHLTICVDPNVRTGLVPAEVYRDRFPRWCALADIVKMSDEDLRFVLPGMSIAEAFDICHGYGARLVIVTRGETGAAASLDGTRISVPAPFTLVADTIGAGDAFTAALLHNLSADALLGSRLPEIPSDRLREALTFAAHVASLTCASPGADPPWSRDLTPRALLPPSP